MRVYGCWAKEFCGSRFRRIPAFGHGPGVGNATRPTAPPSDFAAAGRAVREPIRPKGLRTLTPGGLVWLLRQQGVGVNDCRRYVDELPVRRARVLTEQLKSRRLVDRVTFHENALCQLRDRAAAEGAFEVVVLGEAAQHDVDRALPVLGSASVM